MKILEFKPPTPRGRPALMAQFHADRARMLAAYKAWLESGPAPADVAEELVGTVNALHQMTVMASSPA